jgi:transcriptional regulator GlxA family with amidase domain
VSDRRRVVIVAFDGVQALDVFGPLEVFSQAGGYTTEVVAPTSAPIATSSGTRLLPDRTLTALRGPIDTLVVAGGEGTRTEVVRAGTVGAIRRLAPRSRRVASVCTGAFLLAEAGLLDGRRATTHWAWCDVLAARYPEVTVHPDPIFVRDGNVITSAGVTAGMDLALALVEDDLGHDVALATARQLVVFMKRPGGQSQFSAVLQGQAARRRPLAELQAWIVEHPEEDLTVERLARRTAMSPRNFARAFKREVGVTPARFVEGVRVEAARRMLEDGEEVQTVAVSCGFGTTETLRRCFHRTQGVPASAYRDRFRALDHKEMTA